MRTRRYAKPIFRNWRTLHFEVPFTLNFFISSHLFVKPARNNYGKRNYFRNASIWSTRSPIFLCLGQVRTRQNSRGSWRFSRSERCRKYKNPFPLGMNLRLKFTGDQFSFIKYDCELQNVKWAWSETCTYGYEINGPSVMTNVYHRRTARRLVYSIRKQDIVRTQIT